MRQFRKKPRQPPTGQASQGAGDNKASSSHYEGKATPPAGRATVANVYASPRPEYGDSLFCVSSALLDKDVPPPTIIAPHLQGARHEFLVDNGAGRTMVGFATYEKLPNRPHCVPASHPQGFFCLGPKYDY